MVKRAPKSDRYKPKFPKIELTPEQLAFKETLAAQVKAINEAEKEYQRLRATCKAHLFLPPMTEELREGLKNHDVWTWNYDTACCEICKQGFGFRCPDERSPDSVCHYYTETRDGKHMVKLANGEYVEYTAPEHSPDHESDDWCLYCGAPEERK